MDYKGYLQFNVEAIDMRHVNEGVQEIRDILKKKAVEAFNLYDDDLLIEEDLVADIHMVETRASTKDAKPSKHRSSKEEESTTVDSDFDTSVKLREKDEYIKSLERKVEEMIIRVEQMQNQIFQSQLSRPDQLEPTVHIMGEHNRKIDSNLKLPKVTSPISLADKDIRQMIETQGFTIKTFEKLLNKASNLYEEASKMPFLKDYTEDKKASNPLKSFGKRTTMVSVVDKGKKLINIHLNDSYVENNPELAEIDQEVQEFSSPDLTPQGENESDVLSDEQVSSSQDHLLVMEHAPCGTILNSKSNFPWEAKLPSHKIIQSSFP
ncbi:hypothetical protein MA16_Dca020028 [Dendrobium catenatum]|uniref:Uncharacterized protein n=1 Tax=Dendrobium catenatum TaxID=906689 RepID=A0A2I0VYK3_9ASPA|nr:hypothetical protein MA16_Dca020028 [Dendrobium catenatum]